jgi:hypothetical protein
MEEALGLYLFPQLFFKPIRERCEGSSSRDSLLISGSDMRSNVEAIMLAYRRLHSVENATDFFLFPLGIVSYPSPGASSYDCRARNIMEMCTSQYFVHSELLVGSGCPIVVFEELQAPWSNAKPPSDVAQSYVECVSRAVSILNAAEIAHMDLRPANVMWRRLTADRPEVQIRVIDLEDAVPFGFYLRLVSVLRDDPRYPVSRADSRQLIASSAIHNDWFCESVSSWATQFEVESYSEYMATHSIQFEMSVLK